MKTTIGDLKQLVRGELSLIKESVGESLLLTKWQTMKVVASGYNNGDKYAGVPGDVADATMRAVGDARGKPYDPSFDGVMIKQDADGTYYASGLAHSSAEGSVWSGGDWQSVTIVDDGDVEDTWAGLIPSRVKLPSDVQAKLDTFLADSDPADWNTARELSRWLKDLTSGDVEPDYAYHFISDAQVFVEEVVSILGASAPATLKKLASRLDSARRKAESMEHDQ